MTVTRSDGGLVTRTKMDGGVMRRGSRATWAVALVVLAGACTVTVDNTQIVDDPRSASPAW
jgi:hypothetical protein